MAAHPQSAAPPSGDPADSVWPGSRLGLPEYGPGSAGRWGRRILALLIDWVLATLVVSVLTGRSVTAPPVGFERWYPLIVFALEVWVLTSTVGGSAGQLVLRLQVRRLDGGRLDALRALARTVLVCLVIPAVIYNRDQRGLHDLVADSIVVRR